MNKQKKQNKPPGAGQAVGILLGGYKKLSCRHGAVRRFGNGWDIPYVFIVWYAARAFSAGG